MTTLSASAPAAPGHPLRNPGFRTLWIGRTISNLGDQFYLVALPWLVLQITNSTLALGSIMVLATIPQLAFMLLGGALSDRISPRRIWMSTTAVRTVSVAVVGALIWMHALQLWHLYILAVIFGVADAFSAPAAQAFIPSVVGSEQLPAANSVTQVSQQLTTILGPAPAGIVIRVLGTAWAFIIDAFSFLFVIAALWSLPDPPQAHAATARKSSVWHSIAEGLRYMLGDPALRSLLLLVATLNFCLAGPMSIGLPWIAKARFASPIVFSVFVTALAAGGLGGALLAGMFKPARRGLALLAVSLILGLCIALVGWVTNLAFLALTLLLMGLAAGFVNVHIIAWFQQRVERSMLGRAMSVLSLASLGLAPVSLMLSGIAVQWSLLGMFAAAAVLMLGVTALATVTRSARDIR